MNEKAIIRLVRSATLKSIMQDTPSFVDPVFADKEPCNPLSACIKVRGCIW